MSENITAPFVIADPHFAHKNIIVQCHRPFQTIEEHDETLIQNWNRVVQKNNTVIIIGDFAFKNHNHYIMALNGKKILVRGNHDKMPLACLNNFTAYYDGLFRTNIEGQDVTFCHYCMVSWASSCHNSWLIYGHSHGRIKEPIDKFAFDAGVDVWNYTPISWKMVKYVMSKRIKKQHQPENELEKNVSENRNRNLTYIKECHSNAN